MSTTVVLARKILLVLAMTAAGIASLPAQPAAAHVAGELVQPPAPPEGEGRGLERIWLRQQRQHDRLAFLFDHSQQQIERAQGWIDRAAADGKDPTALQGALDAFEAAVQEARPAFESAKGIIAAHKGFDADGNVIDAEAARQTVEDMAAKLREIRDGLREPRSALWDALRALRAGNRQP